MVKAATAERHARDGELLATDVGKRIREARQERSMSLAQLGGNDLSRSFLSLVELGRSRISLRALSIVADRLELPLSYFLDEGLAGTGAASELALDQAEIALEEKKPEVCLHRLDGIQPAQSMECRWHLLRGRALLGLGRGTEAIPVLQEAVRRAERMEDPTLHAQAEFQLGSAVYSTGAFDEALIHLRRALDLLGGLPEDRLLLGKITVGIGHVLY